MTQKLNISNKKKLHLVKEIYNQALMDIEKIKKERDKKIKQLIKEIDQRHIEKVLKDIKNIK